MKRSSQLVANNKKARHEYFVDDTYEAGIVLTGTEIKSVRQGKVNIKESFARVDNGEIFVFGMNISPYDHGNIFNVDPLRPRKLLLNRKEIRKIEEEMSTRGMSLIPLKMYINDDGRAKLLIGIARGKKMYDKRNDMAKKDATRKMQQAMKRGY